MSPGAEWAGGISSSDSDDVSGSSCSVIAKRDTVGNSIESPSSASCVQGCGRGVWAEGAIRLYGGMNQVCWYSDKCTAHLYSMASCKTMWSTAKTHEGHGCCMRPTARACLQLRGVSLHTGKPAVHIVAVCGVGSRVFHDKPDGAVCFAWHRLSAVLTRTHAHVWTRRCGAGVVAAHRHRPQDSGGAVLFQRLATACAGLVQCDFELCSHEDRPQT